ncbi:MAG: hypothetical protein QXU79_04435 [Candidatus Micrarchaeaceae archaeon]
MPINPIVLMYTHIKKYTTLSYIYYIITLNNNQSSATPAPFQQLITINPSLLGSSNFSADLGNIRFYADSAFTQPLYAWVESGNSNTSTATNIWVKLPNGIPANSSITIYMKLEPVGTEYDGVYMGEAPQLSSTYAQFDNGSNVFNNYWNFAGTSLPSGFTSSGVKTTVNNGLTVSATTAGTTGYLSSGVTISEPIIVEAYTSSFPLTSSYWYEYGIISASTSSNEGTFIQAGTSSIFGQQQNSSGQYSNSANLATVALTDVILTINPISSTETLYSYNYGSSVSDTTDAPTYPLPVGYQGQSTTQSSYYYWRIRAYPPNGVMPSIKTNLIVISITNNQSSATPAPFQQLITINPSLLGSANFSTDLGNIRFYADSAFTQPLYAWVESGNSNTSTATNIWVKLPNGIPANSSITIYMKLESVGTEYDGVYMGEAPHLSSTYAQYDNGSNVFSLYANGNTPISDFTVTSGVTLTQATGVAYGSTTINALKLTGYTSVSGTIDFYLNTQSLSASQSYIAEGNGQWNTSAQSGDTNIVSLIQSPSSSPNAIGVGGIPGYGNVYFDQEYITAGTYTADKNPQGTAGQLWVYGSLTYIAGSTTFSGYTAPQLYSTSGGYSGSTTNPISSTGSNIYLGIIGSQNSSYPINAYWNWLRVRTYPPNGVMPSINVGIYIPQG